jgi:RHS repeat-associated protein
MIYPIDNLVYGYAAYSNKLLSVYDQSQSIDGFKDGNPQGDDYDYDANGNMTVDRNKNIESITYNHLNLPTEIDFGDSGIIYYIYNALGVKVGKTFTTNYMQQGTVVSKTDYLGGFQYLTPPSGAGGPQFFPTAEGYVKVTDGGKFNYVYNYTDHLGNIRVSYTLNPADGQLKILEENHYYPFGLKHSNYNVDKADFDKDETGFFVILKSVERNKNQYKYNGKELQDDFGLNLYDYGARNYDPAIGRWMNMDAQSEKWHTYSPYTYVLNNPLTYIDPDGNDIIVAFTGGPTGGGKTVNANSKEASTAGRVVQEAQKFAEDNGIEFSGRVITPGVTSASSIKNAMGFIKENYTKGEKVVIYGYSYGGDFAVELAEALEAEGISVDLLVTVDAADGTGSNITVDNEIPENVENAVNFFQDTPSGLPSGAQHGTNSSKEGGKKSKESSGNSNGSPASHGGKKHAANSKKTDVRNYRVKDKNVNHGNIDEKTESLVNTLIQSIMQN